MQLTETGMCFDLNEKAKNRSLLLFVQTKTHTTFFYLPDQPQLMTLSYDFLHKLISNPTHQFHPEEAASFPKVCPVLCSVTTHMTLWLTFQ
jgi:hypothetical protein